MTGVRDAIAVTRPPTSISSKRRVNEHPRPHYTRGLAMQAVLGRIAHEAARIIHLVHDGIAGVDAGGAGDALVLQPLANIDTGRAHLHTELAVDAIAESCRFVVDGTLATAARLTAGSRRRK